MTLAHSVVGTGTNPVVMLHGFMGAGRNLRTFALRWVEADSSKRIFLVDLPGHGESPLPSNDETLQSMARKVIETVGAEAAHWVGHSLGGRVALAAVDANSAAVKAVSMLDISPSAIATEKSESGSVLEVLRRAPATAANRGELRQFLLGEGLSTHISDWLLTNVVSEGEQVRWRFDREALLRLHLRVNSQDLWPIAERRERPLLCVRGSRSRYVTSEDATRLQSIGARVTEVPAGHFVHVEALEPLLRELVDWAR